MKKKRTWLFFAVVFLGLAETLPLYATHLSLSAEAFTLSDNSPDSRIDFGMVGSSASFLIPNQYIAVRYPKFGRFNPFIFRRRPRIRRNLRIFTNNPDSSWTGESGQFNGLVRSDFSDRVPLYFQTFDTVQVSSSVVFSSQTFSSWSLVKDKRDVDWPALRDTAILPRHPTGRTYVYMGAHDSNFNPQGSYSTQLNFELFSNRADTLVPRITHFPFLRIYDLLRKIVILAQAEEDLDLIDGNLFYRYAGESWREIPLFIDDDPLNPFLFRIKAEIPPAEIKAGIFEYWFYVDDGVTQSSFGTQAAPHQVTLFDSLVEEVTTSGAQMDLLDGVPEDGVISVMFPRGALAGRARIRLARAAFTNLPRSGAGQGQSFKTLSGPLWPQFDIESVGQSAVLLRPSLLTLVYNDLDSDGLVDGSNYSEGEMRIFRFDGFEWRFVGGSVDPTLNQVQTPIAAFGRYAIFPMSAMGPITLKPKEKIITPVPQDGINDIAVFDGAAGNSVIRIFDIKGKVIREIRDLGMWDGRDSKNRLVESGVYIYQVESNGRKVNGTITVAK